MGDVKLTDLRRSVLRVVVNSPGSDAVDVAVLLGKDHHWAGPFGRHAPTVEQSSMVQTAVDTSAEAIERLVAFAMQGARYFESRPTGGEDAETMRRIAFAIAALAAERDAAVARAAGWKETFDRSTITALRAALAECADDLAAEIEARWPPPFRAYGDNNRVYDRDMAPVLRARALIEGDPELNE